MGDLTAGAAAKVEQRSVKRGRAYSHSEESSSKADVFAYENWQAINDKFADLLTKVCKKMSEKGINIAEFVLFVVALFPPGDCIPPSPTDLSKVFEAITRHGLWDYFHYSPLVRIVKKFGHGDPEMDTWIKYYKKDLKAYTIVASIEDYIESDLDTCTDQSQEDRAKYNPRYNCPVEWKTDFVDHSLQHLMNVWEMFSDRYLVPDSPPTALLDRVRKGCVSIMWLVPSYLILQLVERAKIDTEFFQIIRILKVTVRGETAYEETTDQRFYYRFYQVHSQAEQQRKQRKQFFERLEEEPKQKLKKRRESAESQPHSSGSDHKTISKLSTSCYESEPTVVDFPTPTTKSSSSEGHRTL